MLHFLPELKSHNIAIAMMLGACLLFSLADTTTKCMVLAGYPALQLGFTRYGFHLLIVGTETYRRGIKREEFADNWLLLSIRSLCLVVSTIANFYALQYLSLSMISAIMFSAPILVSLLSWSFLGEQVGPWRWFAIVFGFIGVLVIVRPFDESFHLSALLVLLSAICLAIYSLITRKLAQHVRAHVMQFFSGVCGTVLLFPAAIWVWKPVDWSILGMMAWVGLISWAGHELLTRAHKRAAVSVLMPFSYSFILYMTISGYVFFAEVPDQYTSIGAVVIIASGLLIWYREKVRARIA